MERLIRKEIMNWMIFTNGKQHYSVWPIEYEIPQGWMVIGRTGTKEECLSYITKIWQEPTR
ncbi:MbtH family NRPS accessory protein [Xenorhabdus griffiniae]|uniref:MbtH family NRPS accessory protein n=1 Tax=Xenorhabdus griffiniae TaxID=351672 RepID=UPI0030CB5462